MNNDQQDTRAHPLSHTFNFGTTLQNVFRNINHAFTNNHNPSSGQQGNGDSRDNIPSIDRSLNSVGGTPDSSPAAPIPSVPAVSPLADVDVSHYSQLDSPQDEDEDSMPELQSINYSEDSDESDASVGVADPEASHQDTTNAGREGVRTGDEATSPPIAPTTGTRRARVDDDGDNDRDRRHPSERVSGPPPLRNTAPQTGAPQQPPHFPAGLFAPLFGLGPSGGNQPAGDAPPERVHTGEATADSSPAGNNPSPGHPPHGVPVVTAGFTLTIPLFGPQAGGPTPGTQAGPGAGPGPGVQGMFGMDAATREELLASFAAFFQEFQAAEEAREDPERAKKLVAGLEVVPTGLVKRLERVGGAPGGHVGDSTNEGTSGCAICWDTLLDAEGDSFTGQQSSEGEAPSSPEVEGQAETHTESLEMEVDAPPASDSQSTSADNTSSEDVKIISLPCAHVFHASCLLPWFTRAKLATCPTCRFNIDPENLTYSPRPRRPFNRAGPARPDIPVPNTTPADPQAAPEAPSEALPGDTRTADAAAPPVDTAHPNAGPRLASAPVPPGGTTAPTGGQPGAQPPGPGFNPFLVGIPILSFPAIQIPLRQPEGQAPGGGNQDAGVDMLTIGLDMFVGGPPPQERGDRRDNTEPADGAANGESNTGAAGGNGAPNPNGIAQDLQSLIEGLLRTTRNIIPQVINGQGPVPPTAGPEAPRADGVQPEPLPQARPAPEAAGPQLAPPPTGGPRAVPAFPFVPNMFRPRPMPPRREPKTWTLPAAPGPSLRQRIEQREREQGLRCSDTSCGIGPCDDDPYPDPCASLTKRVTIHPLPCRDNHENDGHDGFVCSHVFHPACLVSAERVAGWGGQDRTRPLVEVSCPVCRAVGCVTREEWESGVSAL